MCHICIILGHYLTCGTDYTADGPEEILGLVLELSDNMPDKADLLHNCGVGFYRSFLDNTNRKENIDNSILAFKSAVHLTPQGHSDMPSRLNMLGLLFLRRFQLAGDFTDISKAILYQQEALHLIPEGHASMLGCLNNLGNSFQIRFKHMGDLADISDAISHQQKAVHFTLEGHSDMPSLLNNLGVSLDRKSVV